MRLVHLQERGDVLYVPSLKVHAILTLPKVHKDIVNVICYELSSLIKVF